METKNNEKNNNINVDNDVGYAFGNDFRRFRNISTK